MSTQRTETPTKVLTAHLPVSMLDELDQVAVQLERSRTWVVKQALAAWLAQEGERDRLTKEALADVDAGRVIEHQAVQKWATSLGMQYPSALPR